MESEALEAGKQRVRELLINPLVEIGLQKSRKMTQKDHEAGLVKLGNVLAYMDGENLSALKVLVLDSADGQWKEHWPPFVGILEMAKTLQKPPASDSEMVLSFMRSAAGPRALEAGYHVELYRSLKNGQPPRSESAYNVLSRRADVLRLDVGRARERLEREAGSEDDHAFVKWFEKIDAHVRGLISAPVTAGKAA